MYARFKNKRTCHSHTHISLAFIQPLWQTVCTYLSIQTFKKFSFCTVSRNILFQLSISNSWILRKLIFFKYLVRILSIHTPTHLFKKKSAIYGIIMKKELVYWDWTFINGKYLDTNVLYFNINTCISSV